MSSSSSTQRRRTAKLISLSGTLSVVSLLIAVLLLALTFGLSIEHRRRELALLRSVAATPKQIRTLIGREAIIVALLASLVSCALSVPLTDWLRARFTDAGAIPDTIPLSITPLPMAVATAVTLVAATVAARIAARRAARIRPSEALLEGAVEPRSTSPARLISGVLVLRAAVALAALLATLHTEAAAMPVALLTALTFSFAAALLGPLVVRGGTALLGAAAQKASPVGGYLAAHSTRANARKVVGVVIPLALAVTLACTILFTQSTLDYAALRQVHAGTIADFTLHADKPGISNAQVDRLRQTPGVESATAILHTEVRGLGLVKYVAQGVTPGRLAHTLDVGVRRGSMGDMNDHTIAISTTVANGTGAHVGDQFRLHLGDGTRTSLEVVAIYARGLGFGDLTLPHGLVAAHVDDPLADTVLVDTSPGLRAPRATLASATRRIPGLRMSRHSESLEGSATGSSQNADTALLLMGLVIAFTVITAVNLLALATAQRAPEFAQLRLLGATRRQVLRIAHWESIFVAVTAAALGDRDRVHDAARVQHWHDALRHAPHPPPRLRGDRRFRAGSDHGHHRCRHPLCDTTPTHRFEQCIRLSGLRTRRNSSVRIDDRDTTDLERNPHSTIRRDDKTVRFRRGGGQIDLRDRAVSVDAAEAVRAPLGEPEVVVPAGGDGMRPRVRTQRMLDGLSLAVDPSDHARADSDVPHRAVRSGCHPDGRGGRYGK